MNALALHEQITRYDIKRPIRPEYDVHWKLAVRETELLGDSELIV